MKTPEEKKGLLDRYEKEAEKVETQFRRGIITDGERRVQEVRIWTEATDRVREAMERGLKAELFNPIEMMVGSGARGNMMQVRQIAGMRGLVANPRGDMIPRPIKSNFREGLAMLEYFIATPGARKGLVDTALRTADSGYLTRRLVDVAQELIIRSEDCGTTLGVWVEGVSPDTASRRNYLETKLYGRALLNDLTLSDGTVLEANTILGDPEVDALRRDPDIDRVRVRSVLTCDADLGICSLCYGRSLATGNPIELGEAVGVIAAQSIGEPGTQLTMRTFHTGGVAGRDIAGGLPRVVELFEARTPRGAARLARSSGVVRIGEDEGKGVPVTVVSDEGTEETHDPAHAGPPRRGRRPGGQGRRSHRRRSPRSQGAHGDQGRPRDPAVPRRRGPEGVPRPGRVHPRQAHRADRAADDPAHRRAGAGRHRLPARRAGRPEGLPRDEQDDGRGRRSARPRAVPS